MKRRGDNGIDSIVYEPDEDKETKLSASSESTQETKTEAQLETETKSELKDLDPDTIELVRNFSEQWLEELYNHPGEHRPFWEVKNELSSHIARLVGETESYTERLLAPRYRKGAGIFMDELIRFVEQKASDPDKRKFQQFQEALYENLFSYTDGISTEVGKVDMFFLTAKANRVPEAQGWFGQSIVGEMVYELNWSSNETVQTIIDRINKSSTGDVLDILEQCETLGSNAAAQGWAYSALDRIIRIVQAVKEQGSPLVKYAADFALERFEQETQNPTLGVVTYHGNRSSGRLPDSLSKQLAQESVALQEQIQPDVDIPPRGNMYKVAKDAVAIMDHSNLPRYFAKIDYNSLPEVEGVSNVAIREAKKIATEDNLKSGKRFVQVLNYLNNEVLAPLQEQEGNVSLERLAAQWSEVTQVLSPEQWQEYFKALEKQDQRDRDFGQKQREINVTAESDNERLSNEFLERFTEIAPKIIELLPNDYLKQVYGEFEECKNNNLERAFKAAEDFAQHFRIARDFGRQIKLDSAANAQEGNQLVGQLVRAYDTLLNQQQQNWDIAQSKQQKLLQKYERDPERLEALRAYIMTNQKLTQSAEQFAADIQSFLDRQPGPTFEPVLAHFEKYENIPKSPELNPFARTQEQQLPLLLQHLHQPELRSRIEDDLQVKLSDISLRAQVYFLKYLSSRDSVQYNHLRDVVGQQSSPELRRQITEAFLACAEHEDNVDYILTLVEKVQDEEALQHVFGKYLSITDRLTNIKEFINQSFIKSGDASPEAVNKVGRRMLHRANEFLKELAGSANELERLVAHMEAIDDDVVTLGAAMKELKRKGLLHLSDIQGLELVTKPASEITQQEVEELLSLQLKTRSVVEEYSQTELLESLQEELERYIKSDQQAVFKILTQEGKPIGFIHVHPDEQDPNTVWIGGLNMHPSGQGTPLTETIIDEIKQEYFGKYTCKLEVLKDKTDLQRYYASQGFRLTGQENPQAGKTFLVMERPPDQQASLRAAA